MAKNYCWSRQRVTVDLDRDLLLVMAENYRWSQQGITADQAREVLLIKAEITAGQGRELL